MKKYSKDKLKAKRIVKTCIILLCVLAVISIGILLFSVFTNNIVVEKIDFSPSNVSDDVAQNSTPVIVNNLILGATYDNKWVSSERYYLNSKNGENTEVDAYSKTGKLGKYTVGKILKQSNSSSVYTNISKKNLLNEYFAVASSDKNIMLNPANKITDINDKYAEEVKKALGIYRIFNMSVKVIDVYNITISQSERGYLIFATNKINKGVGVYSAVVYVSDTGKRKIVKYNYINDKENTENWPIYSFNFVADLNLDGKNELIIQETKEFEVKYDILEYRDGKFYEVLSSIAKQ